MLETEESTVRKDEYKETIFGLLPMDWEIIQFNEVFELMKSYSFSRNDLTDNENEGDTYYIHYGDIHSKFERLILNLNDRNSAKIPLLRDSSKPEKDLVYLQEGDLIIADASEDYEGVAECIEIGKITKGKKLISGLHTIVARDKNGKTAKKFRSHLLKSWPVAKELKKIATGISVLGVSKTNLGKVKIPLPPFNQQKIIAEILTTWDKTISKTEKLIQAKKRYKKGLMQRLLSGSVRFPEFVKSEDLRKTRFGIYPKDWEYKKIQEVTTEVKNKVGDETEDYTVMSCTKHDGLVSSLEYFDRQVFSKDISNYKAVEKGEFAYATNHVEEGSIGYNNWCKKGAISPMYTVFKADQIKIDNDYLYAILKTENYRRIFEIFTNGTVNRRGSLRWKDFKKIKVPVPSLEEQKVISTVLKKDEQEIQLLEKQLEKYQLQKKGLMQQLLTGKVRVKSE